MVIENFLFVIWEGGFGKLCRKCAILVNSTAKTQPYVANRKRKNRAERPEGAEGENERAIRLLGFPANQVTARHEKTDRLTTTKAKIAISRKAKKPKRK
jgi:hypothetical protein